MKATDEAEDRLDAIHQRTEADEKRYRDKDGTTSGSDPAQTSDASSSRDLLAVRSEQEDSVRE